MGTEKALASLRKYRHSSESSLLAGAAIIMEISWTGPYELRHVISKNVAF